MSCGAGVPPVFLILRKRKDGRRGRLLHNLIDQSMPPLSYSYGKGVGGKGFLGRFSSRHILRNRHHREHLAFTSRGERVVQRTRGVQ